MLTKKVKYALKAVLYLAKRYDDEHLIAVNDISREEYIPYKFLEKILLQLKRKGILISKIGRLGGYQLSRPPAEIMVGEIIRHIDGTIAPVSCVSKTAYENCFDCENERTCEIRRTMQMVRDAMAKVLDGTSLADAISMDSKVASTLRYAFAQ